MIKFDLYFNPFYWIGFITNNELEKNDITYMDFNEVRKKIIIEINSYQKFGDISVYKHALTLLNNNVDLADKFMLSNEYGGYDKGQLNRIKKYLIDNGELENENNELDN